PSRIIDEDTAALLCEFREPKTIIDAILKYCGSHELDAERTLEDAFPVLTRLMESGLLVAPDSDQAKRIAACFGRGDRLAGFEIIERVQTLEDSELYRAMSGNGVPAALKIARPGHESRMRPVLRNEAAVLRRLEGSVAPRLLAEEEA